MQNDLEGGFVWKNILRQWPANEEMEILKKGAPDMEETVIEDINQNSFHVFLRFYASIGNVYSNTNLPILIFFTGMGKTKYLTQILFHTLLLYNIPFVFYPDIYSINHMKMKSLVETVEQANILYKYVDAQFPQNPKLLVGHSLGSGIAAQVALHNNQNSNLMGVLLLSTSPNITLAIKPLEFLEKFIRFFSKLFLGNILDTEAALKQISVPVKVIHTKDDKMFYVKVIYRMMEELIKKQNIDFEIREGTHGELIGNSKQLFYDIKDFIKNN